MIEVRQRGLAKGMVVRRALALPVVSQEVVSIETGTGDWWFLVGAAVRTMSIVEMI
jgi:hypothetical protein